MRHLIGVVVSLLAFKACTVKAFGATPTQSVHAWCERHLVAWDPDQFIERVSSMSEETLIDTREDLLYKTKPNMWSELNEYSYGQVFLKAIERELDVRMKNE